jgi:hypothetical protein
LQGVAKNSEFDEDSILSAELLLVSDNFSELLDTAFFSDELDRLDPFDSALLSLEIASSLHSSQFESLESVNFFVEDELPCPSALLRVAGSLFSADADELSSHPTTANATKPIATRNFFINASKQYFSKENVIYFHPKKRNKPKSINTKAPAHHRQLKFRVANPLHRNSVQNLIHESNSSAKLNLKTKSFKKNYTIWYNTKWYNL